jgi:UDP-N-acetylmuramate dehydrogenase
MPVIVLEAVFKLPERAGNAAGAMAGIRQLFQRRRACQPTSRLTFGSVFKNPAGAPHSAGWYLEQAGMKARRCGGAAVPREHANWIVNLGGATAADVKTLIATGQARVAERFGISLQREVVYFPEDIAGT